MPDLKYLQQRRRRWYAVVEVPKDLRAAAGKPRIVKSLKTESLSEAQRRRHAVVAEIHRHFDTLRQTAKPGLEGFMARALETRMAVGSPDEMVIEDPRNPDQRSTNTAELISLVLDEAKEVAERYGPEEGIRYRDVSLGKGAIIADHYETWAKGCAVKEQRKAQHRTVMKRFLEWSGTYTTAHAVTRTKAGEYVQNLIDSGFAKGTVRSHLSSLAGFWRWMRSRGLVNFEGRSGNPWYEHELGKAKKVVKRRPLSNDDLLRLLQGTYREGRYATVLPDILRLALATGARLGDICELERKDVEKRPDGWWFNIPEGKTEAAARSIPIHSCVAPIVERRMAEGDRYLIPNLIPGGVDQKRGHHVSKAYGRFRRNVGVSGETQKLHALRNTFVAMMEGNEVPESTVAHIVGHKHPTMTFGHYSNGERVKLRDAINKLDYGPEVMSAIEALPPRRSGNEMG